MVLNTGTWKSTKTQRMRWRFDPSALVGWCHVFIKNRGHHLVLPSQLLQKKREKCFFMRFCGILCGLSRPSSCPSLLRNVNSNYFVVVATQADGLSIVLLSRWHYPNFFLTPQSFSVSKSERQQHCVWGDETVQDFTGEKLRAWLSWNNTHR